MRYEKCIKCSRTIGWVGLVTNSVLMLLKAFVGLVSGSQAMVADAMYSAKDVVGSLMAIVGMTVSERPLDRDHPYGHGKIEFILSLFVSVIFILIAGYLLVHAVTTLMDESSHRAPHLIALWAALLVVIINVVMYFYSRCVSIETNSPLVRTLAKHHHGDAASSGLVAAGIIGAHYLNMPWIDTAVAALETLHLMYMGGHVFWDSAKGLMDRSVNKGTRAKITELAESVEGVSSVTMLRTRHVGQYIHVEMTVAVASDMLVMEAFEVSEAVKEKIIHNIPRVGAIQVGTAISDEDAETRENIRANWAGENQGGEPMLAED
ncbi:magnetosome biogenesis CDF transporter MamM [Magnetovibrio sp. PR-2]|uniref:magnetosome biogenesis CDF transporter MamM n=1 Tax=Magnetovibrio sp. PR-2 TaxID=3120356 RepID=UPI002FCE0655